EFAGNSSASPVPTNTIGFNDATPLSSFTIPIELEPAPPGGISRTVGLALANTSASQNTVTLDLVDSPGITRATQSLALPPFGQATIDLANVPAFKSVLPAANFIGTLTVSSTGPVASIALGDAQGPFFGTPPVAVGRTGQIAIPHIVSGGGFVTKLTLFDLSGVQNLLDMKFFDATGTLLQDQAVQLAGHGAVRVSTSEADRFGPQQEKWALITAPNPAAVNLFFEYQDPNTHQVVNTVGFNDSPPVTDFTIPVEFNPLGRTVGLALANASGSPAAITLDLLDQSGQVLASAPLSIANNTQIVTDLSSTPAFKSALPSSNFVGSVTISSSSPLSGIALGDDFGPFYSTPIMAGRASATPSATPLPNTKVVPNSDIQTFIISNDGTTLTFSVSSSFAQGIRVGDILVAGPTAALPTGLLVRVLSITRVGDQLILTVQPATLQEAFADLRFDIEQPLTPDTLTLTSAQPGINVFAVSPARRDAVAGSELPPNACDGSPVTLVQMLDVPLAGDPSNPDVRLNGELELCPILQFHYGLLARFVSVAVGLGEHTRIAVTGKLGTELSLKKDLATFKGPPIPVGTTGVTITPVIRPFVKIDGAVSASFSVAVNQNASGTVGLSYVAGKVTPI